MILNLTLTGVTPLLMHNVRLADPLDPWAKAMKAVSSKRAKTDEDHAELARLEWMGGLYWDDEIGVYIPAENVVASIIRGGTKAKAGTAIRQAVTYIPSREGLLWPVEHDGPHDREELYATGRFTDRRSVVVSRNRIVRTRPRFDRWTVRGQLEIDETVIGHEDFAHHAAVAGRLVGLGDARLIGMGRYNIEVNA